MLVRNGPHAVEKDANYAITLIERDNSVILPWWRDHEDVIFMLNSYRNMKCSHTIGLFCASYAREHCCCHFSCTSSFSVHFLSPCFSFLLPPPPALPSLCNLLLSISIQVAFGAAYSCPVTSQHAWPLTRTLTSCSLS